MRVPDAVLEVAAQFNVSVHHLRQHMREVGFDPVHPVGYPEVVAAITELLTDPCFDLCGYTFMETRLRMTFGMVVRPALVKAAMREVNPEAHQRRAKEAAKVRYQYKVHASDANNPPLSLPQILLYPRSQGPAACTTLTGMRSWPSCGGYGYMVLLMATPGS